jgi:HSP20 family protein
MASLRQAMDRLMDETMSENPAQEREMTLALDVIEEENGFILRALVPGLEADDIDIEIINNTVSIRGELKTEEAADKTKYLACELPQGKFSRVVTFPVEVNSANVEANLKNGVLYLHIPKAEAHRPKTIKVSAN